MLMQKSMSAVATRRSRISNARHRRHIASRLAEALEPRTLLSGTSLLSPNLGPLELSAPAITTADSDTVVAGVGGTFTVIATGSPTPSWNEVGQLPMGVSLTDNGDGTATFNILPTVLATTAGITITASNGNAPNASQDFTLTIIQPNVLTISNLNDSGAGSLRSAITQANQAGGTDLIKAASGLKGTIKLLSALPALDANIIILGTGLTISGAKSTGSVLSVDAGVSAEFHNLAITGGSGVNGGGIDNAGTLALFNCTITGNRASTSGGGIYNDATGVMTISNSAIDQNTVSGDGIGGGGLYSNGGVVFASDSSFSKNAAGGGGNSGGGGIASAPINDTVNPGTLTVTNCTIALNTAVFDGGISDNSTVFSLIDSTVDQNKTVSNDGDGGVDIFLNGGTATISGTIIAKNSYPDLTSSSTTITGSNDLIGDGSDIVVQVNAHCTLQNSLRGTQTHPLDPKLGALANNGGATPTQAELAGAPGITHGADFPVLDSTNADITVTDQRGVARPRKFGGIDIGAFQLPPAYLANHLLILPIAKTIVAGGDIASSATSSSFTVELLNSKGNVDTTNNSTITVAFASAPKNASLIEGVQVNAGIATVSDVTASLIGNYVVEAIGTGLTSAKSNKFTVTADTSSAHLVVFQLPFDGTVGKPLFPKLVVHVEDNFGNTITTGHSKVTVSILTNPTNGLLSGTTTVSTSKGVAIFPTLKLSEAGAPYELQLTDNSLPAGNTTQSFMADIGMGITSVAIPHTASSYTVGSTITLTTTFKSDLPSTIPFTGDATVEALGEPLGDAQLSANGAIKFLLTNVSVGTYTCTIDYAGDNNHDPIGSNSFTLKLV